MRSRAAIPPPGSQVLPNGRKTTHKEFSRMPGEPPPPNYYFLVVLISTNQYIYQKTTTQIRLGPRTPYGPSPVADKL